MNDVINIEIRDVFINTEKMKSGNLGTFRTVGAVKWNNSYV